MKQAEDSGEDMIVDVPEDMGNIAEDTRPRGLIWAARRGCPSDNEENVEDHPERSDTDDNARDGHVDIPKVAGQRTTEQQQRNLQHQWQGLHDVIEVPSDDATQFPLAILATFHGSPSHVGQCVSIQPLLAEHSEEGGKD